MTIKKPGVDVARIRPLFLPFTFFIVVLLLNLAFISKSFRFDSLKLALWAENGQIFIPVQQHHILLTLLNYLFYSFWSLFFKTESALLPLSVFNCFIGAAGVAVFFAALKALFENRLVAAFGALGLAFSLDYWKYSTLVETHIMPTVFLIIALYFLIVAVKKQSAGSIFYAGFFSSLSLFSSGANAVFIPAFIIFIIFTETLDSERRLRYVKRYIATVLLCWLVPFLLLVLAVLLREVRLSPQSVSFSHLPILVYNWFKGPLYLTRNFRTGNIVFMMQHILSSVFVFKGKPVATFIFYGVAFFLFLKRRKILFRGHRNVIFLALAAAVYFLTALLLYEPRNLERYTPLLPFAWLMICLGAERALSGSSSMRRKTVAFSLILLLFVNNLVFYIAPKHYEKNNRLLQEVLSFREFSKENDVMIIKRVNIKAIYLAYFGRRRCIVLRKYMPEERYSRDYLLDVKSDIDTVLEEGGRVFVERNIIELDKKRYLGTLPRFYLTAAGFIKRNYRIQRHLTDENITFYSLSII